MTTTRPSLPGTAGLWLPTRNGHARGWVERHGFPCAEVWEYPRSLHPELQTPRARQDEANALALGEWVWFVRWGGPGRDADGHLRWAQGQAPTAIEAMRRADVMLEMAGWALLGRGAEQLPLFGRAA